VGYAEAHSRNRRQSSDCDHDPAGTHFYGIQLLFQCGPCSRNGSVSLLHRHRPAKSEREKSIFHSCRQFRLLRTAVSRYCCYSDASLAPAARISRQRGGERSLVGIHKCYSRDWCHYLGRTFFYSAYIPLYRQNPFARSFHRLCIVVSPGHRTVDGHGRDVDGLGRLLGRRVISRF